MLNRTDGEHFWGRVSIVRSIEEEPLFTVTSLHTTGRDHRKEQIRGEVNIYAVSGYQQPRVSTIHTIST